MNERETLRGPPFECPDCRNDYARLGQHWTMGDCDPALSADQHAVLEGVVLGGAGGLTFHLVRRF